MLEKDVGMLRLCSVAGIRIHHQLSIGQVLLQEEGIWAWLPTEAALPRRTRRASQI
jgi:hypothetical protein